MADILIVEDNVHLALSLSDVLSSRGHKVLRSTTLREAYQLLGERAFELVLVDRSLPDGNGLDLVSFLADVYFPTRVVLMSVRGTGTERVEGLEQGADDYLVKPFQIDECLLKVRKLLQKIKVESNDSFKVRDYTVYPELGVVEIGNKKIFLRPKEMTIFSVLCQYKNRVVTRESLVKRVWPLEQETPDKSTVDVYMRRIRTVLHDRSLIKTVRGFGYLLRDE
jgi:DNA-binding response OmpR family regulator